MRPERRGRHSSAVRQAPHSVARDRGNHRRSRSRPRREDEWASTASNTSTASSTASYARHRDWDHRGRRVDRGGRVDFGGVDVGVAHGGGDGPDGHSASAGRSSRRGNERDASMLLDGGGGGAEMSAEKRRRQERKWRLQQEQERLQQVEQERLQQLQQQQLSNMERHRREMAGISARRGRGRGGRTDYWKGRGSDAKTKVQQHILELKLFYCIGRQARGGRGCVGGRSLFSIEYCLLSWYLPTRFRY